MLYVLPRTRCDCLQASVVGLFSIHWVFLPMFCFLLTALTFCTQLIFLHPYTLLNILNFVTPVVLGVDLDNRSLYPSRCWSCHFPRHSDGTKGMWPPRDCVPPSRPYHGTWDSGLSVAQALSPLFIPVGALSWSLSSCWPACSGCLPP